MPVFDIASAIGDGFHSFDPEVFPFAEGGRFMVAFLVSRFKKVVFFGYDIIFQFPHHLEGEARIFFQRFVRLAQNIFGRIGKRQSVLVIIGTKDIDSRELREGICECRSIAGDHVKVRSSGLHVIREQAGTVNTLPGAEYAVEVLSAFHHEVQCLQPPVGACIAEIHHADAVGFNKPYDVAFCKFF